MALPGANFMLPAYQMAVSVGGQLPVANGWPMAPSPAVYPLGFYPATFGPLPLSVPGPIAVPGMGLPIATPPMSFAPLPWFPQPLVSASPNGFVPFFPQFNPNASSTPAQLAATQLTPSNSTPPAAAKNEDDGVVENEGCDTAVAKRGKSKKRKEPVSKRKPRVKDKRRKEESREMDGEYKQLGKEEDKRKIRWLKKIKLLPRPHEDAFEVLVEIPRTMRTHFYQRLEVSLPVGLACFGGKNERLLNCLRLLRPINGEFRGVPGFDAVTHYAQWQWYSAMLKNAGVEHKEFISDPKNLITPEQVKNAFILSNTAAIFNQVITIKGKIVEPYEPLEQEEEQFIDHVQKYFNLGAGEEYHYKIDKTLLFKPFKPNESQAALYKKIRKDWVKTLSEFIQERKSFFIVKKKQPLQQREYVRFKDEQFCKDFANDLEKLQGRLNFLRGGALLNGSASASPAVNPGLREHKPSPKPIRLLASAPRRFSLGAGSGSGGGSGSAAASYQKPLSPAGILAIMSERAAPSLAAAVPVLSTSPQQQSDKAELPQCRG